MRRKQIVAQRKQETAQLAVTPAQADNDAQVLGMWLARSESPHTRRAYERTVRELLAHAGRPLAALRVSDVQAWLETLTDKAPATVRQRLAAIKSLMTFAHELGYIEFNAGRVLKAPSVKQTLAERILSEEQVLAMLHAENSPRNRVLLRVLYSSGLRVSEAVSLRWRDVQARDEGVQLTVQGKGGKTRAVRLSVAVSEQLQALREDAGDDAPVFTSRKGGSLTSRQVGRIVRTAGERVGVEGVSPHWLRHAHASHALERGAPIHLVQATLGHASVATTGVYLHARPTESSGRYLAV
jgi:site-specific recombinase XerD